jgi:hypothetical protein
MAGCCPPRRCRSLCCRLRRAAKDSSPASRTPEACIEALDDADAVIAFATDSRVGKYLDDYGDESWELDALPPDVLAGLIRDAIEEEMEPDAFGAAKEREEEYRSRIGRLLEEHGSVLDLDT